MKWTFLWPDCYLGGFVKPAGPGIVLDCLYEVREDGVLLTFPHKVSEKQLDSIFLPYSAPDDTLTLPGGKGMLSRTSRTEAQRALWKR
jgi:hypothetical protein